jgi:hypothetical protein
MCEWSDKGALAHILLASEDAFDFEHFILTFDEVKNGRVFGNLLKAHVVISDHAMARLFERMRTNSRADVLTNLQHLMLHRDPEEGEEMEVRGFDGTFHLRGITITDKQGRSRPPNWLVTTFIGDKP